MSGDPWVDGRYGYGIVDAETRLQVIRGCKCRAKLRRIVGYEGNQRTVQRAAAARLRALERAGKGGGV